MRFTNMFTNMLTNILPASCAPHSYHPYRRDGMYTICKCRRNSIHAHRRICDTNHRGH